MKRISIAAMLFINIATLQVSTARGATCQNGYVHFGVTGWYAPEALGQSSSAADYGTDNEINCAGGPYGYEGQAMTINSMVASFARIEATIGSNYLPLDLSCSAKVSVNGASLLEDDLSDFFPRRTENPMDYYSFSRVISETEREIIRSQVRLGLNTFRASFKCVDYPVANETLEFTLRVVESPDARFAGITLNRGNEFTNSRDVELSIQYPIGSTYMQVPCEVAVSNDGGFASDSTVISTYSTSRIEWQLRASREERLPKTVYVRIRRCRNSLQPAQYWDATIYSDDIILDTVDPKLTSLSASRIAGKSSVDEESVGKAAASGRVRLTMKAKDNRSGVAKVQISRTKSAKGATSVAFKKTLNVSMPKSAKTIYVRVQDGAGNWSKWLLTRIK